MINGQLETELLFCDSIFVVSVQKYLLHDNVLFYQSTLVIDFLARICIYTINHSLYLFDLVPCDVYNCIH